MNQEKNKPTEKKSSSFWQSQRILLKGVLIAFLTLALLIPTLMIQNLIEERSTRSYVVKREISDQWGQNQEIRGPIISIPFWQTYKDENGKYSQVKKYAYFLPHLLDINGQLMPTIKYRSIFEMVVYTSDLKISGSFQEFNFEQLKVSKKNFILEEAELIFGLSDFKGIQEEVTFMWNGKKIQLNAGSYQENLLGNCLSAPINLKEANLTASNTFQLDLKLRGSEGIFFQPFGKTTKVSLSGQWGDPSFQGTSPDYHINDSVFHANWTVLSINRTYPQQWLSEDSYSFDNSSFGVNLLQPINHYSKNIRTVKYGILIILLTFTVYFFIEIFQKKSAHAIQYILVGFALCMFYTLLLSFSEVVGFNSAYLIAAVATVTLLGLYTKSVFHSNKSALIFSTFLSGMYGFIYSLIQLQDRALLVGSIGLFLILAVVMFLSRKINWYNK